MRHMTRTALLASAAIIERKGDDEEDPASIVTKALDGHKAEIDKKVDEKLKDIETKADQTAITGRMDKLEARMNRHSATDKKDEPTEEQKSFNAFLRRGKEHLLDEERKTLTVSNDQGGGYLAPAQLETEIQRELVEFSPIRDYARVTPTSAPAIIFPKRVGRLAAKWVGEIEPRPKSEPDYAQAEIPVHEIAVYVDVSNQLLEDAAVNIEAELRYDFSEEFGVKEGEAFVNGDGVKKPLGIMADPAIKQVLNGHATNISAEALISLMYAVPVQYRNRGQWIMNGASVATIRKLKDSQGNFLWQPGLQNGEPSSLLGRPIVEAVDMDDAAANAFPIAFGDLSTGYRILDRIGLSVLRDPYKRAEEGITRFHARRRVGGGVVRPDAFRKLKMATS